MAATTKKNKKNGTDKIYQMVTDTIIEHLESGTVPWQRPWKVEGGVHMNLKSKRPYRGINQFLLDLAAMQGGYSSPYWITFKQGMEWGGNLKKVNGEDEEGTGQRTSVVVFWKMLRHETNEVDDKGNTIFKMVPLLRYYRVFNVEQWEGIEDRIPAVTEPEKEFDAIERAQALIDNMPQAPVIRHQGDAAFYSPRLDSVTLPKQEQFDTPEDYYKTAYHELTHATGHEDRTGRIKDWTTFGSEPYAKEELVAEMGASMLAAFANIEQPLVENSAAYIASWLQRLKEDKKLVVQAAAQAQKAADFIIGPEDEEEETDEA